MAAGARRTIAANGLQPRIKVLAKSSTEVTIRDLPAPADVLIFELFGTLLLGESALHYVADTRRRLMGPMFTVVPRRGVQLATLIECHDLESLMRPRSWNGLHLEACDSSFPTGVVFTQSLGFHLSAVPHRLLTNGAEVVAVDFAIDNPEDLPASRMCHFVATATGVAHAVMLSWEVFAGADTDGTSSTPLTTHPVTSSFARNTHWGQALQLIPQGLSVAEGTAIELTARFNARRTLLRFEALET